MNFSLKASMMQLAVAAEFENYKKGITEAVNDSIVDENFVDGNVLFKTMFNRSSLSNLLSPKSLIPSKLGPRLIDVRHNYRTNLRGSNGKIDHDATSTECKPLFRQVTDNIIQIKAGVDIKEAIRLSLYWKKELGDHFYGVVLRDTKTSKIMINPFHILTAINTLAEADSRYFARAKFDLNIFYYPDREKIDKQFATKACEDNGGRELAATMVEDIMMTYMNRVNTIKKVTEITPMDNEGNITAKYVTAKHKDEKGGEEYYVVAHQLLTDGILAPYYGTSLIRLKDRDDTMGMPLGPLRTCNINTRTDIDSRAMQGVCTGSSNNRTLKGLRTLTHAYLGSAFHTMLMEEGSLVFIEEMIKKSEQIYASYGITIDGYVPPSEEPTPTETSPEPTAEAAVLPED